MKIVVSLSNNDSRLAWVGASLLALMSLILGPACASADFVFGASDSSSSSGPLDAEADFQIANDKITITLTNLQNNISNVGHAISGLSFKITDSKPSSLTFTSISGDLIDILGKRTVTDLGTTTYSGKSGSDSLKDGSWHFNKTYDNSDLNLTALGWHGQPDHLVIGPPNCSLKGQLHPFFLNSVTFVLSAPCLNSNSSIGCVVFDFGTCAGESPLDGKPQNTHLAPAPSSIILLGAGVFGVLGCMSVRRVRWDSTAARQQFHLFLIG